MEALSSTLFVSKFSETRTVLHPPSSSSSSSSSSSCSLIKIPIKRSGSLKIADTSRFLRVCGLPGDVSGDVEGEDASGFGLVSEESVSSLSEGNLNPNWSPEMGVDEMSKTETPLTVSYGSVTGGGSRTGLFRTPISGGVQSATSAHGLPRPALAVRNLMEQARFAHLCTVMSRMHHRREGYPFGSLVDFAPDSMGHPIFSFSPLAIHTRNLLADPKCTLVVQIPGWSGLSNARVTIFGDVFPLPEHQQEWAHKQYIAKHQQGPSQQWGNFYYFRMQNISDIYFIGGFGTVAWVDVKEYEALQPDKIAVDGGEQNLKALNAIFSKPLKELLSMEVEVDDAALISIDSKGTDIRVRQGAQFNIQRIPFEEGHAVQTLEEAKAALWKLINQGRHIDDTWVAYIGNDFRRRTLRWEKIASGIPTGRFGHTCIVVGNHLVLFGGINDDGIRHNDTWIGQLVLHRTPGFAVSWRLLELSSAPPPPRGAHAGCCIGNNSMLIHGGIGPSGHRLGDTWVLDLSENLRFGTWRKVVTTTPSPPPRSGHTLTCVAGNRTVLFGGRGLSYDVLNDLWLFEFSGKCSNWVQIVYDSQTIPGGISLPRVGHSATLILGGRVLIYGGEDSERRRKDDFWVVDVGAITPVSPVMNIWKRLNAKGYKPESRSFHGACTDQSGRLLFVLGGMVDGDDRPAEPGGLRFDAELFLAELVIFKCDTEEE